MKAASLRLTTQQIAQSDRPREGKRPFCITGLCLAVAFSFITSNSINAQESTPQYTKEKLQSLYVTFLRKHGYETDINRYGDVQFMSEGRLHTIYVKPDAPMRFQMADHHIHQIESTDDYSRALVAANHATMATDVVKVFGHNNNQIWGAIDTYVLAPEDFTPLFSRYMDALKAGRDSFARKMSELKIGELRAIGTSIGTDSHGSVVSLDFGPTPKGRLENRQVTDETLRLISSMPTLTHVNLAGCSQITDDGLRYLSKLINLRMLNLSGLYNQAATDEGGAESQIANGGYDIRMTHITANGIAQLSKLQNLQAFAVNHSLIDGSMMPLNQWPKLKSLYVIGVEFSGDGLSRIRESLPRDCVLHGEKSDGNNAGLE